MSLKHEISIYTDRIYYEDETIEDAREIANIIRKHISHLGKFNIYYRPKPKTFWQKLQRAISPS